MRKILLALSMLCMSSIVTQAQNPTFAWVKQFDGSSQCSTQKIVTDAIGNVYTTGYFYGTVDFDPSISVYNLSSNGSQDIFISKLDASGNFVWAKSIGGSLQDNGLAIAIDAIGNLYITGDFQGTVDFDPSVSVNNLTAIGQDIFVSKFNASGNLLWAKSTEGSNWGLCQGNGITVDAFGNVFTIGDFMGTVDFDPSVSVYNLTYSGLNGYTDIFISKLDASGNFLWAKSIGGINTDQGNGIAVDASGNVYATGSFNGNVLFNPLPPYNSLNSNYAVGYGYANSAFISKLDASGNFVWAKGMGGNISGSASSGNGITLDASGNVYTIGSFDGTVDFDPSSLVNNLTSNGNRDVYVSKLDVSGSFVWAKSFGGFIGDNGLSITLDNSSNVYTTGHFAGSVDFDPSSGVYNLISNSGNDIFISKLNASGNFTWAQSFGGYDNDAGNGITLDALNNVYTTGFIGYTVDFDPSASIYNLSPSGSAGSSFILKLSQSSSTNTAPYFTGGASQNLSLCQNAFAVTSINSLMDVYDADNGQTLTWSVVTQPVHGMLNGFPATNITNGGAALASGLNYQAGSNQFNGLDTFQIAVSDGIASDTIAFYVTVNALPNSDAGADKTICSGGSTTLTATGGDAYMWNTGATSQSIIVNTAGTYSVTATSAAGCSAMSNPVFVSVKAMPTTIKIKVVGLTSVCDPSTIPFVIDLPLGSITGFDYQWKLSGTPIVGATDSTFNADGSGAYSLTVSGGATCYKNSAAKTVTVKPLPTASFTAGGSTTFCQGGSVTFTAPTITGYTYAWLNNGVSAGAGATKVFKVAGNITLIAKLAGCADTTTTPVTIVVNPLPIATVSADPSTPTTFCAGQSCKLLASSSTSAVHYSWWTPTNLPISFYPPDSVTCTVNVGAIWRVMLSDNNGCWSKFSSGITTKVNAIPVAGIISTGNATAIAFATNSYIKLNASPSSGVTWQWYLNGNAISGATTKTYNATTAGAYTVVCTKLGCTGTSIAMNLTKASAKEEVGTTNNTGETVFELSAYPNPVNDVLTVTISGIETTEGTIQVMDVNGKLVVSVPFDASTTLSNRAQDVKVINCQLSTTNWSSGLYFIRYKDIEGNVGTIKITKQ